MLLGIPLLWAGATPEVAAFTRLVPIQIPIFSAFGSLGGLAIFVSDRTKGVYEYLLAYRIRPRSLFTNGLLATTVAAGITVGLSLLVVVGAATARGVAITADLEEAIFLYALPMSFASAWFMAIVGMIWSSLSSPRTGLSSPVGMAPMIGVAPGAFVLVAAEAFPASAYDYITRLSALVLMLAVVLLLALSSRYLGRERFLSPL